MSTVAFKRKLLRGMNKVCNWPTSKEVYVDDICNSKERRRIKVGRCCKGVIRVSKP